MKVVHVPFCFYPDAVGGTEVYVNSLARCLNHLGVESVIAAPGSNVESHAYEYLGLRVVRFPVADASPRMLSELYGDGDPHAADQFATILDQEKPDVVHLHAFTRGVSLLMAQAAKRRGIRLVFTYHTPTASCQRGTLLRYGQEVCDGALDLRTCVRCKLDSLGVNKFNGKLLSMVPARLGSMLSDVHLAGGIWTGLRMTELVGRSHQSVRSLISEADAVVVLCQWTKDLLLRNGLALEKLTLSRHGLPYASDSRPSRLLAAENRPLRIAFLGRADPTKGADFLIEALQRCPDLNIKLDLYGIVQGKADSTYYDVLKSLAAGDQRINFISSVRAEKVVELLSTYHVLAVPSRCLETGPLVVLEAFAAGIPVMGSNLGGIAELVSHNTDGILVEPGLVSGWVTALQQLYDNPSLLERLKTNISPPRSMEAVAEDMASLYAKLIGASAHIHQAEPTYAHS